MGSLEVQIPPPLIQTILLVGMGEPTLKSISDISSLSLSSREGDGFRIPEEFVIPESICPSLPYDSLPIVELPIIDLKGLDLDNACNTASELAKTCEEWGFFQVVNHRVPLEALQRVAQIGNDFFSLPIHEKEKGNLPIMGYVGKHAAISGIGASWVETLTFSILPENNVESFEAKMWPHAGNPHFRKSINEFAKEMESLEIIVLQLLAMGLGLESTTFFSEPFKSGDLKTKRSFVSFNYYPPCPNPSKVLGSFPHTDPTCLTVLFQDGVSGLQIMAKDGTWHNVHHQPNGLLFFVGDVLQGWSNNRFPACIHRVVLNQRMPRLSFLHGANPPSDLVLEPPSKLVGNDRPLLYKPFTNAGFMKFRSFVHVMSPHEPKPMDIYAGLDSTRNMA